MPDDQFQITSRTRVDDVRKAAGFTSRGWHTYLRVTLQQARLFVKQSDEPPSSWSDINYSQKSKMHAEINKELSDQGLPTVTEDIYYWRMSLAMPPLIRQWKIDKDHTRNASKNALAAPLESESLVLPAIRSHPDLAPHIPPSSHRTSGTLPDEEDRSKPGAAKDA